MKKTMVKYENIRKVYHFGETENVVIKNISLNIYEGEYVWITGKSGSGKSTLLNLLTGIDYADGGKITVKEDEITNSNFAHRF